LGFLAKGVPKPLSLPPKFFWFKKNLLGWQLIFWWNNVFYPFNPAEGPLPTQISFGPKVGTPNPFQNLPSRFESQLPIKILGKEIF